MFPKLRPIETTIDAVIGAAKDNPPPTPAPPAPTAPPSQISLPPPTPLSVPRVTSPGASPSNQRPYWIGPKTPRPTTAGALPAMKQPVTVDYASPGLQPPVYVFTDLSDPQWEAVEMDSGKNDNGEFWFHKQFEVEEGEYQYKFRLGPGDWWVCDETKPVVDDGAGNKNNCVVVKPATVVTQPTATMPTQSTTHANVVEPVTAPSVKAPSDQPKPAAPLSLNTDQGAANHASVAPLPQEKSTTEPRKDSVQPPPAIVVKPSDEQSVSPTSQPVQPTVKDEKAVPAESAAPTLPHEQPQTQPSVAQAPETKVEEHGVAGPFLAHEDVSPPSIPSTDEHEHHNDHDHDMPLLPHETLHPDSIEQTHAPLLQHEATGMSPSRSEPAEPPPQPWSDEIDLNDPSLVRFPTDHGGIMEHIRRASIQQSQGEVDAVNSPKSAISETSTSSVSPIISLPSVREDDEEADGVDDNNNDDVPTDPLLAPKLVVMLEDPLPEVAAADSTSLPTAPITPPMTPKETEEVVTAVVMEAEAKAILQNVARERETDVADAGKRQSEIDTTVVVDLVQERGLFGTVAEVLSNPLSWFAFAGLAIAVVAGVYRLRYA